MKTKTFDSVKMMREIREKLSQDFSPISLKEKIALLEKEFPLIKKGEGDRHSVFDGLPKHEFNGHPDLAGG